MWRVLVASAVLLAASLSAATAQEKASSGPLPRFVMSADKAAYFVGEPVALTFTLTNDAGKPIKGTFRLGFELNNLELFYRRNGQRELPFVSTAVKTRR